MPQSLCPTKPKLNTLLAREAGVKLLLFVKQCFTFICQDCDLITRTLLILHFKTDVCNRELKTVLSSIQSTKCKFLQVYESRLIFSFPAFRADDS